MFTEPLPRNGRYFLSHLLTAGLYATISKTTPFTENINFSLTDVWRFSLVTRAEILVRRGQYSARYYYQILTKIRKYRYFLLKLSNIKCIKNLFKRFSSCCMRPDRQKDMAKLIGTFLQLLVENPPTNLLYYFTFTAYRAPRSKKRWLEGSILAFKMPTGARHDVCFPLRNIKGRKPRHQRQTDTGIV
jgi:hypothetical protein